MGNILLAANGGIDVMNTYGFIILLCLVIILSYGFNLIASKTRIPSVLMLIGLGVGLQFLADAAHFEPPNLNFALEVLGQVGLIMIVLEAALELEIRRNKLPLIGKSFGAALVGLMFSVAGIAVIVYYMGNLGQHTNDMSWLTAILDATCLAVISSAIVIPSVSVLEGERKEWMIYEATFSDILGIMLFYFLLTLESTPLQQAGLDFAGSFLLTIVGSVVVSYILVVVFQRIKTHIKLFLLIAVLMLLYFTGKLFHLSPLWIILIFGLVLANSRLFFRGWLAQWVDHEKIQNIDRDFTVLTLEFAFLIRTFFFVVFGFTLDLTSLLSPQAWLEAIAITALLYLVRFGALRAFRWKDNLNPELWIAPRGLITILLFFSIPANLMAEEALFSPGILLIVILLTSGIMTWGMVRYRGEAPRTNLEEIRMEGMLPLELDPMAPQEVDAPWTPSSAAEASAHAGLDDAPSAAGSDFGTPPPGHENKTEPITPPGEGLADSTEVSSGMERGSNSGSSSSRPNGGGGTAESGDAEPHPPKT